MRKVLTFKFANIQTCPLWLSLLFQQPETADCSFVLEMFEGDPEQLNSVQHPCWLMIGLVVILQYPIYRGVSFFFAFNIHEPHFGLFGHVWTMLCERHALNPQQKVSVRKPLGSSLPDTKCFPFKMQARWEQDGKHRIGIGKPKRTVNSI